MTLEIGIYNHATGEQTVREMTADEVAELEATNAAVAARNAEIQAELDAVAAEEAAKVQAKAEIFAKLGLTEEEISALLG